MPIEQSKVDQELESLASTPDRADEAQLLASLDALIARQGGDPATFSGKLIRDMMQTALKLVKDQRGTGELKLMTTALKEMRHAYRVFARYAEPHKVTIFGSARTPVDHPDYAAAVVFGRLMADAGWMVITGAGGGIMAAGHEGPGREASFGVAIRLPFEQKTNDFIAGDDKLIHFRYFFTRKLMFLSQAEAVALFPGGFGTLDEAFETLTLVQTGKSTVIPIVMLEGKGGSYWRDYDRAMRGLLLDRGFIDADDLSLYTICETQEQARDRIVGFYRNYHSSRYVRDDLVIRLRSPLTPAAIDDLNTRFKDIVKSGSIAQRGPFDQEDDARDLPRLVFHHSRSKYARLLALIDAINAAPTA